MGRPPCCDKNGVKKGPWTPEEDILLVSYVQEHGPGNWRAVPTNSGLRRCSKSCRLRWTNYLRPGIKRGNFTDHEEKMIIQLQALLGNKWAAISSYLPDRTDNDIKNYWNTHLKKKLRKLQTGGLHEFGDQKEELFSSPHSISRGQWEKKLQTDIHMAKQALQDALSLDKPIPLIPKQESSSGFINFPENKQTQNYTYASSTENIAKLLKGWMKPKKEQNQTASSSSQSSCVESQKEKGSELFEALFGLESFGSSNSDFSQSLSPEVSVFQGESKPEVSGLGSFSMLEDWLLDEEDKGHLSDFSFDEHADLF